MNRRIIPLVLLGWLAPLAPLAAQTPLPAKPVAVPFQLLPSRHIVVDVKVNGKGPFKFIFDTGAPINLIGNRVAKEAGLASGASGGTLSLLLSGPTQAKVKELTIGDVTATKVPAMVMDHPTVKTISDIFEKEVGPIHGIIGFPFFARYAMTVDYQRSELSLKPNGYVPGDYLTEMIDRLNAAVAAGSTPKVVAPAGYWGLTVEKPTGDSDSGVVVKRVVKGGPAATSGLLVGDRIVTIDGRWTDTVSDTYLAASLVKIRRRAKVQIERAGKPVELEITPANGL